MQNVIHNHNYRRWSNNVGLPGNPEQSNNMVKYLNMSWRLSLHANFVSIIGNDLKGSGFEEIILKLIYTSRRIKNIRKYLFNVRMHFITTYSYSV